MSRLDRFLMLKSGVCYDLIVYMWLARGLCDHCLVLLTVDEEYWGPPAADIEMLGRLTLYRQFYRNQSQGCMIYMKTN